MALYKIVDLDGVEQYAIADTMEDALGLWRSAFEMEDIDPYEIHYLVSDGNILAKVEVVEEQGTTDASP